MKSTSENGAVVLAGVVILMLLFIFFLFVCFNPESWRPSWMRVETAEEKTAEDRLKARDSTFIPMAQDTLRPWEYVLVRPPFLHEGMQTTSNFYRGGRWWIREMSDNGFYLIAPGLTIDQKWIFMTRHKGAVRDSILTEMLR